MPEEKTAITPAVHRQLGVDLFNYTWTLIDKSDRTEDESQMMIHAAHASAYHWRQVGTPLNFSRSDWQISRVYAVLNRPEASLYHAQHCLNICEAEGIGDFDLAFAYEALARSYAAGDQIEEAQKYLDLANQAGKKIKKKGDRDYFFDELATIPNGAE
jgi:hypothetical protein